VYEFLGFLSEVVLFGECVDNNNMHTL